MDRRGEDRGGERAAEGREKEERGRKSRKKRRRELAYMTLVIVEAKSKGLQS